MDGNIYYTFSSPSAHTSLGEGGLVARLVKALQPWLGHTACIIDDDVLVWHTPKLCKCSLYAKSVCIVC